MLKALLLSLTTTALAVMATAQINLVPNGSFEDTVDCYVPTQCTLLKAAHWRNPTSSTPDMWDCDLDRVCGYAMDTVAPTIMGWQSAYEGIRFAGWLLWDGPGNPSCEYAMVRLQAPLVQGQAYVVSLKYSLADGYMYALDHIGAWLGIDSLNSASQYSLEVDPQLRLRDPWSNYLSEQHDWGTVRDTLVATGGEQWLVIGNFDTDEDVDAEVVNPESILPSTYYFFDDVSVVPLAVAGVAEAGPSAWWDGSRLNLMGKFTDGPVEFLLWDAAGRLLERSEVWLGAGKTIPVRASLRSGLYIAQVRGHGAFFAVKFVKEEGGL